MPGIVKPESRSDGPAAAGAGCWASSQPLTPGPTGRGPPAATSDGSWTRSAGRRSPAPPAPPAAGRGPSPRSPRTTSRRPGPRRPRPPGPRRTGAAPSGRARVGHRAQHAQLTRRRARGHRREPPTLARQDGDQQRYGCGHGEGPGGRIGRQEPLMIPSSAVSALLQHHTRRVAARHAVSDDFALGPGTWVGARKWTEPRRPGSTRHRR